MEKRLFDLNIEEVLDNWEVSHALREVISNALDEQFLSGSEDIEIVKDGAAWIIRDYGRGLRIEHFTLNENAEKLGASTGVIGKFGVGLKDALATFHRRGIGVLISSPFGTFTLAQTTKHGFEDITTLHVRYDQEDREERGTVFRLSGVTDEQMAEARGYFLRFSDEEVLEETRYGTILARSGDAGRVYISGVFAAEEENFLFSYNVTNLTDAMKKRLNRERLNVGRTTYSDRVKAMLKDAREPAVLDALSKEIEQRAGRQLRDELQWIDIALVALTHLAATRDVVFVTEQELHRHPDIMDHARHDGLDIVIVTGSEKAKLVEQAEAGGPATRTFEAYVREFNESFEYSFVEEEQLTDAERAILGSTAELFRLVGVRAGRGPRVLISETMRLGRDDTDGVWDPQLGAIVIKRSKLATHLSFAATLLHEVAHALTGTVDATREFESVLTRYLGKTSVAALGPHKAAPPI